MPLLQNLAPGQQHLYFLHVCLGHKEPLAPIKYEGKIDLILSDSVNTKLSRKILALLIFSALWLEL